MAVKLPDVFDVIASKLLWSKEIFEILSNKMVKKDCNYFYVRNIIRTFQLDIQDKPIPFKNKENLVKDCV